VGREGGGVLLIGGDEVIAEAARAAAEPLDMRVAVTEGLADGLRAIAEERPVVTLLSLDLPGSDLALAGRLAEEGGAGALVLLSSHVGPKLAMDAARAGAEDVIGTPVSVATLTEVLRAATARATSVPLPDDRELPEDGLIGGSAGLVEAFKTIGRVGPSGATVLVTGESGTGKELVAQAIHRISPRVRRPFVAVNCAAIPEDLLESELFGHERGAFTGAVSRKIGRFERADGGTIFLDEIGDMSLVLQAKILRVLQEREIERLGGEERVPVNVRVLAATHRDLGALIEKGDFREDLYYRLAVVKLHLPPLRDRGTDVRDLTLFYAARFAREHDRPISAVSVEALEVLARHPWPGNVRELRNVVERAVLLGTGDTLLAEHIDLEGRAGPAAPQPHAATLPGYSPEMSMAEVEALHMEQVLRRVKGHYGRAAEILGMHRNTVSRKAQEYGIDVD
jgi:DNA-binding NtrC family response regulator